MKHVVIAMAVAAGVSSASLSAHHSYSAYDTDRLVDDRLEGRLAEIGRAEIARDERYFRITRVVGGADCAQTSTS